MGSHTWLEGWLAARGGYQQHDAHVEAWIRWKTRKLVKAFKISRRG